MSSIRISIFTLPDVVKNKNILINSKYQFQDGKMKVIQSDGLLIKPILEGYYGCKYEEEELSETNSAASASGGDLTASSTKGTPPADPPPAAK